MKKTILFTLVIVLVISCTQTKQEKSITSSILDAKCIPTIEAFFKKIEVGDYKTAVVFLLSGNENINLNDSLTGVLKLKFTQINETSGKFISKRLMRQKSIENDFGVYCYIAKYERKFYRFTFVFYNNEKDVKIYRFSFDEALDVELEESLKLYVN